MFPNHRVHGKRADVDLFFAAVVLINRLEYSDEEKTAILTKIFLCFQLPKISMRSNKDAIIFFFFCEN